MTNVETEEKVEVVDEVEVLEPAAPSYNFTFGKDDDRVTYVQRPLSFFGKMELFSVLGAAVDQAMAAGDLSLNDIFNIPTADVSDLKEADLFIGAVAKVVQHVPELLKDIYCISLAVPRHEREYVKELMEAPVDEGGLSDDDGIRLLNNFVDQNWDAMLDFFSAKMLPLLGKILGGQELPSSKPSKATQRRTRKQ